VPVCAGTTGLQPRPSASQRSQRRLKVMSWPSQPPADELSVTPVIGSPTILGAVVLTGYLFTIEFEPPASHQSPGTPLCVPRT
jgi:hypothetical protein